MVGGTYNIQIVAGLVAGLKGKAVGGGIGLFLATARMSKTYWRFRSGGASCAGGEAKAMAMGVAGSSPTLGAGETVLVLIGTVSQPFSAVTGEREVPPLSPCLPPPSVEGAPPLAGTPPTALQMYLLCQWRLRRAATDDVTRILQRSVNFSIPPQASYRTLARPPLSTHSWCIYLGGTR
jgi:hypothetical protein